MAYDFYLADRIRKVLFDNKVKCKEKKMFGGIAFMVKNKMCVGIVKNDLMARIDPDMMETALKKNGARPMDFTGKPMKGFVYVNPQGIESTKELRYWIKLCLSYNPKAKPSKKK